MKYTEIEGECESTEFERKKCGCLHCARARKDHLIFERIEELENRLMELEEVIEEKLNGR